MLIRVFFVYSLTHLRTHPLTHSFTHSFICLLDQRLHFFVITSAYLCLKFTPPPPTRIVPGSVNLIKSMYGNTCSFTTHTHTHTHTYTQIHTHTRFYYTSYSWLLFCFTQIFGISVLYFAFRFTPISSANLHRLLYFTSNYH